MFQFVNCVGERERERERERNESPAPLLSSAPLQKEWIRSKKGKKKRKRENFGGLDEIIELSDKSSEHTDSDRGRERNKINGVATCIT